MNLRYRLCPSYAGKNHAQIHHPSSPLTPPLRCTSNQEQPMSQDRPRRAMTLRRTSALRTKQFQRPRSPQNATQTRPIQQRQCLNRSKLTQLDDDHKEVLQRKEDLISQQNIPSRADFHHHHEKLRDNSTSVTCVGEIPRKPNRKEVYDQSKIVHCRIIERTIAKTIEFKPSLDIYTASQTQLMMFLLYLASFLVYSSDLDDEHDEEEDYYCRESGADYDIQRIKSSTNTQQSPMQTSKAKKQPFQIARKFEAILLNLSYLRHTAVILDRTVKTKMIIATKISPERLNRAIGPKPYRLSCPKFAVAVLGWAISLTALKRSQYELKIEEQRLVRQCFQLVQKATIKKLSESIRKGRKRSSELVKMPTRIRLRVTMINALKISVLAMMNVLLVVQAVCSNLCLHDLFYSGFLWSPAEVKCPSFRLSQAGQADISSSTISIASSMANSSIMFSNSMSSYTFSSSLPSISVSCSTTQRVLSSSAQICETRQVRQQKPNMIKGLILPKFMYILIEKHHSNHQKHGITNEAKMMN